MKCINYTEKVKWLYWLYAFLIVYPSSLNGQNVNDSLKNDLTPYELMSSYYENNFHPFKKKNIYVGLSFSLEDKKLENTDYLIQQVIEGEMLDYNIVAKVGYYTGNYGMAGVNFNYYQKQFEGSIYREPDTLQSKSITRGFAITPHFRSSVPLTKNERLSFFTDIGLSFGMANSLKREIKYNDEIQKQYGTDYLFGLGISPGVTFFAMENFAFEIQLNVLGYNLKVSENNMNDGPSSKEIRQNVDFNINILSLELGLAYYFGSNK
ncbi:hypothetical protein [Carboxylicivirga linearis]|uniref:Outer membrane protein beta-barrel domain-containing protein n=1 Tax=Carboxylicivirga linearis TaxID=1628157 RepID=A0ABS5K1U4_9BACT|nr:hypothetical protein [Carboxylicivirga linearis]MBS2101122.1 hypothetical protein [Carboxylicivirga linearis]